MSASAAASQPRTVHVETTFGTIRGVDHSGLMSFKGVPFAAPPRGDLRWRAPRPPQSWEGVRDAMECGPICPQNVAPVGGALAAMAEPEPQDEDCLWLNVWTTGLEPHSRPVMVWIHGGAFHVGSGSKPVMDGSALARRDVVVVTFNYRVNAFGFLYLDEHFDGYEGSGNCGILDQIAALEWVQSNIDRFGGDPTRVTVFGESAGGMSVGTLLGTPAASGLFQRGIAQSGAAHHNLTPAAASRVAAHLLDSLGIRRGDGEALRAVPTSAVLDAVARLSSLPPAASAELLGDDAERKMLLQPVIDGVVRDRLPIEAVRAGAAQGVDLIVGSTAEEWRLFKYGVPEEVRDLIPPPDVGSYFRRSEHTEAEVIRAYERDWPGASKADVDCAIETDLWFTIPALRLADAQSQHNPNTYRYRLTWRSPAAEGLLGACHALDIPFVFGNLDVPSLLGDDPPVLLSDEMQQAWVRFATTGDPGWARWDPAVRPTWDFDVPSSLVNDPEGERYQLWDGVLEPT